MFYKITDKESKLYKQLHELRSKELKIEKENDAAVKQLVGDDWDQFSGWSGQQNFHRVTTYSGFAFKHPENLPPKTWKKHKEYEDIYVPDRRTKNGRAIAEALDNLPHSSVICVFEILEMQMLGRFTFPYIEICDDETIVLFVDDKFDLEKKFPDVVEITKKEATGLLEGCKK